MTMRNQPTFPSWLRNAYARCAELIPRGLQSETIAIDDACMRVTSEPVLACNGVPPWTVATCDGYAFNNDDTNPAGGTRPWMLRIDANHLGMGRQIDSPWVDPLAPGTAIDVCAYAPLPANADTVLREEISTALDAIRHKQVVLRRPLPHGANVVKRASEYAIGDVLFPKGCRITPERQAAMIAAGVREVSVSTLPRIGVAVSSYTRCGTGATCARWQTPDTCGQYIRSLLRQWGLKVEPVEYISPPSCAGLTSEARRGEERLYRERVKELAERYDLIIGSGMLSTESHRHLGLNCLSWFDACSYDDFTDINQAPGQRFNFAKSRDRSPPLTEVSKFVDEYGLARGSRSVLHRDQATLINLPGLLSSVAVLMHVLVRRIIDLYEFVEVPGPYWEIGELARDVGCDRETNLMQWAKIVWGPRGEPLIDPLPAQEPHCIAPFVNAEVIAAIPASPGRLAAGSRIHFLRLDLVRQPATPNVAAPQPIVNPPTELKPMQQLQMTVAQSWACLDAWLASMPDAIPGGFNAPATDDEIVVLEGAVGAKLPEDFIASWKIHGGQADQDGVCFEGESLLDIKGILSEWTCWRDLVVDGEFDGMTSDPDAGVKDAWYNLAWIPFTRNGMGDCLCIDLDPAPGGTVGQVIRMWHDDDRRERVAASFEEWLCRMVTDITGLEAQQV